MFDRFGIDFGAVLASQMAPGERMDSGQIGTWAVQYGPKIVLVRSFFRLVVRDRFFWSSWGRFGLRLGSHFRSFWRLGRPKLVPKPSSNRLNIEKVCFHETV